MKKSPLLVFISLVFTNLIIAQPSSFQIIVEPFSIPGLQGLQSYAYGQADGKWLIVGGRNDGLHRRQPFGAFSANGRNNELIVIDPVSLKKWELPLSSLTIDLQDQLSSTNMQFYQEGNFLYLIGGYGYSDSIRQFNTYNQLTAVDLPGVIKAVINKDPLRPYFRQIADTGFAVTGGHLKKINDSYYLVGGQKFSGRYNPMGPDHGPGFIQQYTDQIRKFNITDNGINIVVSNFKSITDTTAFHRRDYNMVPQILAGGAEGLSIFSGVFQPTANIPYLNSITIDEQGYTMDHSFAQYYNHYHSAVLPLYSEKNNEMHNIFFGGIAQYYDSAGVLVQHDEVPFIKTIARVTRDNKGNLAEYKMPVEMPGLLGTGAEFILLPGVPHFSNGVVKLDQLHRENTLVGHIYGGINSTYPNVFFINTGVESSSSSKLFNVYLKKTNATATDKLNIQSINGLQLQVYPDMDESSFLINFSLVKKTETELIISNAQSKTIKKEILKGTNTGTNTIIKTIRSIRAGDTFWVTIKTAYAQSTQKIIIEP